MNETNILYPLDGDNIRNKDSYVKLFTQINKFIQKKYKEKQFIKFNEILNQLNISYELYILALRSPIKKRKIFLKRDLEEIYINKKTSEIKNRVFIAKPEYLFKKMDPEDEDIKQPNNIDKYAYCPKQLHSMCLADFVAKTDIVQKYTPIQSDDE